MDSTHCIDEALSSMIVDLKSLNYSVCFIVKRDTKRIDFVVFLLSIKVIAGMM